MRRRTITLAAICRKLRLPLPRNDHSLRHGRWMEPDAAKALVERAKAAIESGGHGRDISNEPWGDLVARWKREGRMD